VIGLISRACRIAYDNNDKLLNHLLVQEALKNNTEVADIFYKKEFLKELVKCIDHFSPTAEDLSFLTWVGKEQKITIADIRKEWGVIK
jgi:hypothetical protein